jgi:hypothetical protein
MDVLGVPHAGAVGVADDQDDAERALIEKNQQYKQLLMESCSTFITSIPPPKTGHQPKRSL